MLYRFFILCMVISCSVFNVAQAASVTIRADYWYPMNGEKGSDYPGYMIELARAIFEPEGVEVDYDVMPWIRALQQTRDGEIDCVVGAYKNDAPDFLFPKEHWGQDQVTFYVLKNDNWRFNQNLDSLVGREIGTISGYSYGKKLDDYFVKHKVQEVSGDHALATNIRKLLNERINTLVESQYVMDSQLALMQLKDKIISAGKTKQGTPMYFACGPNNPKSKMWIKLVDEKLPQLKSSGVFQKILQRYGIAG